MLPPNTIAAADVPEAPTAPLPPGLGSHRDFTDEIKKTAHSPVAEPEGRVKVDDPDPTVIRAAENVPEIINAAVLDPLVGSAPVKLPDGLDRAAALDPEAVAPANDPEGVVRADAPEPTKSIAVPEKEPAGLARVDVPEPATATARPEKEPAGLASAAVLFPVKSTTVPDKEPAGLARADVPEADTVAVPWKK